MIPVPPRRLAPASVGDLTHVSGVYRTPYGQVRTDWTRPTAESS